jgi:cytoskeletal protein CcmA (bactofilin family)
MDGEKATIIDAAAQVEGKLHGKDARILGKFKGEVELSGSFVLGESGKVEARVVADSAEVAGELQGDLIVRRLVLLEKARVKGTIEAKTLAVQEGAVINGGVAAGEGEPTRPKTPSAEKPPERPTAATPESPKTPDSGTASE